MRAVRPILFALLTLLVSASALAVPPAGSGGGYYGSAWFNSDQGIVVTGATYTECAQALQAGISYRVNNWGWSVTELNPCQYRPPFAHANSPYELSAEIVDLSPSGSLNEANNILKNVAELRRLHSIDSYEAKLGKVLLGASLPR